MMNDVTAQFLQHSAELKSALGDLNEFHRQVAAVAVLLRRTFADGRCLYAAGNGGSATEAQHLAEELIGRYRANRPPYPALALTADSAVVTCIANDFGFEQVFARQLDALGQPGDVFAALSTSGTSPNLLAAVEAARRKRMTVVTFTGRRGRLKGLADHAIIAPSESPARIQELHLHAIHLLCEALEPAINESYG